MIPVWAVPSPTGDHFRGAEPGGAELGGGNSLSDEPNPRAIQGVQTGEKWCRARHRAGDKAKNGSKSIRSEGSW